MKNSTKRTLGGMLPDAKDNGGLPRVKTVKKTVGLHAPDRYDQVSSRASERAAALIASQVPCFGGCMPVPPNRRSA